MPNVSGERAEHVGLGHGGPWSKQQAYQQKRKMTRRRRPHSTHDGSQAAAISITRESLIEWFIGMTGSGGSLNRAITMNDKPLPSLTGAVSGIGGIIRNQPEDFRVEERPLYLPCGEGEHLYLRVTNAACPPRKWSRTWRPGLG